MLVEDPTSEYLFSEEEMEFIRGSRGRGGWPLVHVLSSLLLPAWGSSPGNLYWEFRHTFSSQLLGVPLPAELSDCLPSTGILWCGSDVSRRACLYTCVNSLPPEQLRSKGKGLLLMLLSSHLQNAESCCLSLKNIKQFSLSPNLINPSILRGDIRAVSLPEWNTQDLRHSEVQFFPLWGTRTKLGGVRKRRCKYQWISFVIIHPSVSFHTSSCKGMPQLLPGWPDSILL